MQAILDSYASSRAPKQRDPRLLDDGRVMWADVIESEGAQLVELHHYDSETGIDSIEVLDDSGLVLRAE